MTIQSWVYVCFYKCRDTQSNLVKLNGGENNKTKQKPWMWERRGGGELREHGIVVIRIYLIHGNCQRINLIHLIFKNLGMVLHVYDPSYSRHWSGRILSWGQPELHRNTPSLKKEENKRKIHWDYSGMKTLYLTCLRACPSNSWNIVGFHLHKHSVLQPHRWKQHNVPTK